MHIIEEKNKIAWNKFLLSQPSHDGLFLQSWEWGEIQRLEGREVRRLALVEGDTIKAVASFVHIKLPLAYSYWYCPRGPVGNMPWPLMKKEFESDKKCLMIRVELPYQTDAALELSLQQAGFMWPRLLVRSQSPNTTLLLDLSQSEQQLLAQMKPKTRYNIKVAERHGVTISESSDFEAFWRLLHATSQRNGFNLHARRHYELIHDLLPEVKLFFAAHQGKLLAAHMLVPFGNTISYLHGGTSEELREVMAPHLLHWQEIWQAKQAGFAWYDFWGMNAPSRRDRATLYQPEWEGYTRFKRGFGGVIKEYPGACDMILRPLQYNMLSWLRKIIRSK